MGLHNRCEWNCGATDCDAPVKAVDLKKQPPAGFSEEAKGLRAFVAPKLEKLRKSILGMNDKSL